MVRQIPARRNLMDYQFKFNLENYCEADAEQRDAQESSREIFPSSWITAEVLRITFTRMQRRVVALRNTSR